MADSERNQEQQPSYTPASFEKRTAAWMGIAYVLMLLFLITFFIYTGKEMPGTFPLLLLPVAVAGIVLAVGIVLTVVIVIICLAAIAFGLLLGVPALIHAFQTAYA